jgi:hypothetical protein
MNTFQDFIKAFGGLIKTSLYIVAALALLVFFWGILKYVFMSGSEPEKEKAKGVMVWGLVALFVMVSVWGIVYFFQHDLRLNISNPGGAPTHYPGTNLNQNGNLTPPCGGIFNPCL